jgi:hypothetical protein
VSRILIQERNGQPNVNAVGKNPGSVWDEGEARSNKNVFISFCWWVCPVITTNSFLGWWYPLPGDN